MAAHFDMALLYNFREAPCGGSLVRISCGNRIQNVFHATKVWGQSKVELFLLLLFLKSSSDVSKLHNICAIHVIF